MTRRKIHTLFLGLLLSMMFFGIARSADNGGGGSDPASCVKCVTSRSCGAGYASGGFSCSISCKWSTKTSSYLCSCYTVGDCPGSPDTGTTAP
jgi:hypothetical protein